MDKKRILERLYMDIAIKKFTDPDFTLDGSNRAFVSLNKLTTLWINTGSLCNIECVNCYIKSSPLNDDYAYFPLSEFTRYLDEAEAINMRPDEIGFTGGEPFMNNDIINMIDVALSRNYQVLVLTNAMKPLMRPKMQERLLSLKKNYPSGSLSLRISLDHYTKELHDKERGQGSFDITLEGMDWLSKHGFHLNAAGRSCWGENEHTAREGYHQLFKARLYDIDAFNPQKMVIFPEMDETADVPEITTECWGILNKTPNDVMCASSRMLVLKKGDDKAKVLPCTLITYDDRFIMGESLTHSLRAESEMFKKGAVKLNHPHCAKFCVLGGASCSG